MHRFLCAERRPTWPWRWPTGRATSWPTHRSSTVPLQTCWSRKTGKPSCTHTSVLPDARWVLFWDWGNKEPWVLSDPKETWKFDPNLILSGGNNVLFSHNVWSNQLVGPLNTDGSWKCEGSRTVGGSGRIRTGWITQVVIMFWLLCVFFPPCSLWTPSSCICLCLSPEWLRPAWRRSSGPTRTKPSNCNSERFLNHQNLPDSFLQDRLHAGCWPRTHPPAAPCSLCSRWATSLPDPPILC